MHFSFSADIDRQNNLDYINEEGGSYVASRQIALTDSPLGDSAMTKEQIQSLTTKELWAILRSTNSMTIKFANELTYAKTELMRRGHYIAGERRN